MAKRKTAKAKMRTAAKARAKKKQKTKGKPKRQARVKSVDNASAGNTASSTEVTSPITSDDTQMEFAGTDNETTAHDA